MKNHQYDVRDTFLAKIFNQNGIVKTLTEPKTHSYKLPAQTKKVVRVDLKNRNMIKGYLPRINFKDDGLYTGEGNVINNDGNCKIYVINTTDEEIEKAILLQEIHVYKCFDSELDACTEFTREERITKILEFLEIEKYESKKQEHVEGLVFSFPFTFLLPEKPLPSISIIKHAISLKDDIPINTKQYRHPHILQQVIRETLIKICMKAL